MISACSAKMLTLNSGIRLQLIMSCAITNEDCQKWSNTIKDDSSFDVLMPELKPIIDRIDQESSFAVHLVKRNTVISSILAFTSSLEFFLKDIVGLCLIRNSSLRKKAFSNYKISATDLEKYHTIDQIKKVHIEAISNLQTSGSLFIPKFRKMSKFLGLKDNSDNTKLLKSLDSIWELRNRLAHTNHNSIPDFSFVYGETRFQLHNEITSFDYNLFIINLCSLFADAIDYLVKIDSDALLKWGANDFLESSDIIK